jgi:hypothetical protein
MGAGGGGGGVGCPVFFEPSKLGLRFNKISGLA